MTGHIHLQPVIRRSRVLGTFAAIVLLTQSYQTPAWSQDPEPGVKPVPNGVGKPDTPAVNGQPEVPKLALQQCIDLAMQQHPSLKAAHDSLLATEGGIRALTNLSNKPFTSVISPDLPFRRQQAARGVTVATADIQKLQQEITQDVTVMYFNLIRAKQLERTAGDILTQMELYYTAAEKTVKSGGGIGANQKEQLTVSSLDVFNFAIGKLRGLKMEAATGYERALLALRQLMAEDPSFQFAPTETELPIMGGQVTQEKVVELALGCRPELAQAAAGVDAFRLEVCAQKQIRFRVSVPTLAAGSDLHARHVPAGVHNEKEYRPGSMVPEMPTQLVGSREDRVFRAMALAQRADHLYEGTVNLVRLEAESAYLSWRFSAERQKIAIAQYERMKKFIERVRDDAENIKKQDLLQHEGLFGEAQKDYIEAVFAHIQALAFLERVTAGGVKPAFPGRIVP